MSGKVKMRCARCGKGFKSAGAKQVLCPECATKERQQRNAAKATPATAATAPTASHFAPPRIVGPGASILTPGAVPIVTTSAPPDTGAFGAGARHEHARDGHPRIQPHPQPHGPSSSPPDRSQATTPTKDHAPATRQPQTKPQPARAPRPKVEREPKPPRQPTPVFELTDELRQRIEARYFELAQPVEFDGIRTQIAGELSIPKSVVKRVIFEVRQRQQLPSWWELQAYSGTPEDLERIRTAYLPYLPVPPIGIHKQLATELHLEPTVVYQGIRRIRAEMRLPQFNPQEAHAETREEARVSPTNGMNADVSGT